MQNRAMWWRLLGRGSAAVAMIFCLLVSGCDDDDGFDHVPPEGMGTLIIDNDTFDDIEIFINGAEIGRVRDGNDGFFDLEPGLYRVVLSDEDRDRDYRNDIDILAGRLTVLYVDAPINAFDDEYRVVFEYD